MSKFKVGDRVRILHTDYAECGLDVGSVHDVAELFGEGVCISGIGPCNIGDNLYFRADEVEPCTPAHTIQLNQPYTSKNGTKWECIAIKDGIAFLSSGGDGDAYRFLLNGENLSQGGGLWDIQWEPVVEWVECMSDINISEPQADGFYIFTETAKVNIRFPKIDGTPDFTQATVTPV